jgi:meso-butanediol dehydrogenase / (S,S)-butanediol dehydrogenase / diacetyl reductase
MPGRLDGKIALITGVGGAVGRASALLFAAEGATVVGCDWQDAATQETVEMVRAAGGQMTAKVDLNLGDDKAAAAWINDAANEHGGIDVPVQQRLGAPLWTRGQVARGGLAVHDA